MTFLILPDKHREVGKLLMPQRRREWIASSQRPSVNPLEHGTQYRFRLTAKLDDGHKVWTGWFDDREDADAFLWAIANGTLRQEPELWRLPVPCWEPDLEPTLQYEFATLVFLTTTGAQTYTVASDWNSANNKGETLGAGSSGNSTSSGSQASGGGGAYSLTNNITLTQSGSANYTCAAAGAGLSGANNVSNAGGDTWFNGTTLAGASVSAKGAGATAANVGGPGGATTGVGPGNKFAGGTGGTNTTSSQGAGGAAGPSGIGGNGSTTQGGSANNGTTAGPTTSANGNSGTEFDGSHGCGTGAYGSDKTGGLYGGGGTTSSFSGSASGPGAQGLIVLTYTPASNTLGFDNAKITEPPARSRRMVGYDARAMH